jgi:hypothetical protein
MRRGCCLLWLWVAVVFLLLFPNHLVSMQLPTQSAHDRSGLGPREFMDTWYETLPAARPAFSQRCTSPVAMFAIYCDFLITDDVGPPRPDRRGPPGARACSRPWVRCKTANQAGNVSSERSPSPQKFPRPSLKNQTGGFSTAFS